MLKKRNKRIVSLLLATLLIVTMLPLENLHPVVVQAADSSVTIDTNKVLSTEEIKDSALLSALKEIIKGDATASMTLGELVYYDGEIDLTPYASNIRRIEGLGYARSAIKIDLSAITTITEIPDFEFDKCRAEEIHIPETIVKIGASAFKGCNYLTSINIDNLLYI